MTSRKWYIFAITAFCIASINISAKEATGTVSGKILSADGETLDYANVYLKGTTYSGSANDKGLYHINAPEGNYTIVFSSVGYDKLELKTTIKAHERTKLNVKLKPTAQLA